jgi:2-C-methyl-D-erythritol 4-phosphate cytidylyltransferase / 2-C-methyl-D-erythritol 2,4-cyclodiphosphate synthase
MTVAAVIVAAGAGLRVGGELPKQYQLIGGKPVLRWTLETFLSHGGINHVQVVIGDGHEALFAQAAQGLSLRRPVVGGASRQESCLIGIEACTSLAPQKILIHDAARPFVSTLVIDNVIAALDHADAVIPGLPVADTMKYAPGGTIEKTVDRSAMWFVQTPQGFAFPVILAAHRKAALSRHNYFTDDAAVAEYAGLAVMIIAGDANNVKITAAHDLAAANMKLAHNQYTDKPDLRVGQGIDFHRFARGKSVTLCGVEIPHSHKLTGHSDADVALHALTDAILGAIGESDIGTHFPPSDPQWKGAASFVFLEKAMQLLEARNGVIANVDVTILAEAPKISPHIAAMKAALSPRLRIEHSRIAIKATTTETMGAIGRKEGIAAFATATIRLPS